MVFLFHLRCLVGVFRIIALLAYRLPDGSGEPSYEDLDMFDGRGECNRHAEEAWGEDSPAAQ
jgi:hypothetical protein